MPRRLKGMPYRGKSASRQRLAKELEKARRKQATALQEVRRLEKLWNSQRPWHECKRCGHSWQGVNPDKRPKCCAQCHSKGWRTASQSARARKPTDPPNPAWEGQNRKSKVAATKPQRHPEEVVEIFLQELFVPPVDLEVLTLQTEREVSEELKRSFAGATSGLPLPPFFPGEIRSLVGLPPKSEPSVPPVPVAPQTQMPAPPQLWQPQQPRPPQEPQPESFARPQLPTVAAEEPDWDAILPKLPAETVLMADAAEAAWEEHVELGS